MATEILNKTTSSLEILQELFNEQQRNLTHFFEGIDHQSTDAILKVLLACQGTIFFTGIGKSGFVAKKIAVTMTSTGTKALYLSASDALHGDIGIVSSNDAFIFISKSGENEELLALIPYLRNRNVKLICIVTDPHCRLAKACDYSIALPLLKEICPFGLAPTTSAAIQLIFGDILAVSLMRLKNFQLEEYKLNHPAGQIGKRLNLRVKDLMLVEDALPSCRPEQKLVDLLVELSNKRCGCLLIVNETEKLLGIFTDGDLRRALQKYGPQALDLPISHLMTQGGRYISPEALALDALHAMEADQKHPITVMPVLANDMTLLGLIKMHDIVQSGV